MRPDYPISVVVAYILIKLYILVFELREHITLIIASINTQSEANEHGSTRISQYRIQRLLSKSAHGVHSVDITLMNKIDHY